MGEAVMEDVCRRTIAIRLDAGTDLREVETELIEPVIETSEDERAALWLCAWAYRENACRTWHRPMEVVI
jgi:hypothetical protein